MKWILASTVIWNLQVSPLLMEDQVGILIDAGHQGSVIVYRHPWRGEPSVVGRAWSSQVYPNENFYVVSEEPEDSLVCYSYQREYYDGSFSENIEIGCISTGCH